MFRRFTIFMLMLGFVVPVMAQDTVLEANLTDECVSEFDTDVNYFPDQVEVDYAEAFSVEYFNNYKVVTMTPFVGAEEPVTYVLVQCGTEVPEDIEADAVISVPVERVVTLSTTILPHIVTQGLVDNLIGVDTLAFTTTEEILENSENIASVGSGFDGFNLEVLLDIEPDLIMGQQFFAGDTSFDPLMDVGLPVVLNTDFADTNPLGAAEWGKYLSLFFNTEAIANEAFDTVVSEYDALIELTSEIEERPTVLSSTPFQGSWFMPAGDSTIAQIINDAGGDYLFADLEGTSVSLSIEEVLEQASDADYWVNINQSFWMTTDDMLADDERYAEFSAFETGNVWNNNLDVSEMGGLPYFESGFVNPHLVLADLVAIFHPELLPDHEFNFYMQLEAGE